MTNERMGVVCFCMAIALALPNAGVAQKGYIAAVTKGEITGPVLTELWRQPSDIRSEDLYYGPGGKAHVPHGPFTFIREDLDGSNPKYDVRDARGVKYKIKLGVEARPETVATRLIWAIGYHADEDYFLPEVQVKNVPKHLHRGRNLIGPGGVLHNVRLKRTEDEKKRDIWRWRDNAFAGTRELNGLRVLMAVINNWDLKDVNNAIRDIRRRDGEKERIYEVSDVGASFGGDGIGLTQTRSKGNLKTYRHSKFFRKIGPELVDFDVPARPTLLEIVKPQDFFSRMKLRRIGRHIPRKDARWIGQMLGQLSNRQLRDAFLSAGYSHQEIDGFTLILEERIRELQAL